MQCDYTGSQVAKQEAFQVRAYEELDRNFTYQLVILQFAC